jgi:hypothetical protein
MKIPNWEEGKTYTETDFVCSMGRTHVLIDSSRRSNSPHAPITSTSIPLRREVFTNKVKERNNLEFMDAVKDSFPNNIEDINRNWRDL